MKINNFKKEKPHFLAIHHIFDNHRAYKLKQKCVSLSNTNARATERRQHIYCSRLVQY